MARSLSIGPQAAATEDRKIDMLVAAVDPDFLRIFDLEFKSGEPQIALNSAHSVILLERTANRLFGTTEVIGRRVLLQNRIEVTITGVIGAIRQPSHMGDVAAAGLPFEALVPMDLLRDLKTSAGIGVPIDPDNDAWGNDVFFTYMLLPADGSLDRGAAERGPPGICGSPRRRHGLSYAWCSPPCRCSE